MLAHPMVFVTGKGGTGKTSVAGALALAAAAAGRRPLVCEVGGADRLARLFGVAAGAAEPVELRDGVWWLGVDAERSLGEWLTRRAGGPVAALLRRSQAFSYLVAAAPGATEVAVIGKVADEARAGRFAPVILDAPSTGHALALLAAPGTFAGLAPAGPVAGDARGVRDFLRDRARTACVATALPEPMAVDETLELERGLCGAVGHGPDLIVVDAVHPDRFTDAEAALMERTAPGNLALVLQEHRRARAQAAAVGELRARAHAPVVTLPFVFPPTGGVERLERLAASLGQAP